MPIITIDPIKQWFDNLGKIKEEMKNINHLTEDDIKLFSEQTLQDLLNNQTNRNIRLQQFCQTELGFNVNTPTINNQAQSFFNFLDEISFSIEENLKRLWEVTAVHFNPTLSSKTRSQIMRMKFDEAFGGNPFPSNNAKLELHSKMILFVPKEFYSIDGTQLSNGQKKLSDIIKSILS